MRPVQVTVWIPGEVWHAVHALAPQEGNTNAVIFRAVDDYVTATARNQTHQSGKYCALVQALSTPVAEFHLSARPASALRMLHIRYVYGLVPKSPTDLLTLRNFGSKSLKETQDTRTTRGLTLDMPLEDDSYRAAVVVSGAANIEAAR